ncbi:hypothetical protein B2A_01236, partial [mine drainage metagenome]
SNISNKRGKTITIDDIGLFDLIEFADGYYKNKKETLQHLRSLRNFIHEANIIKENDAHSALTKITDVLNLLFELPSEISIDMTCKVCGGKHRYRIDTAEYFIGNKKELQCTNPNIKTEDKRYVITLMP